MGGVEEVGRDPRMRGRQGKGAEGWPEGLVAFARLA